MPTLAKRQKGTFDHFRTVLCCHEIGRSLRADAVEKHGGRLLATQKCTKKLCDIDTRDGEPNKVLALRCEIIVGKQSLAWRYARLRCPQTS